MALKIRLTRMGATHRPFYRLVVAESSKRRDGRVVDTLGYYNPVPSQPEIKVEEKKALEWLRKGAQTSETARSLLKKTGVWQRFQFLKQGMPEDKVEEKVAEILESRSTEKQTTVQPAEPAEPEPIPSETATAETAAQGPEPEEQASEESSSTEPAPETAAQSEENAVEESSPGGVASDEQTAPSESAKGE